MPDSGPAFPVLIDADALDARIGELARRIAADHAADPPLCVVVLEGARVFAESLCRRLPWGSGFATVKVASYGDRTVSSGRVSIVQDLGSSVAGRTVLVIEDIVDTGRTVDFLARHLAGAGAREVHVATLLSKPARRVVPVAVRYTGFEIPDCFVIGFGMDAAGRHRELPHVAALGGDAAARSVRVPRP
jgi:hypoxanthine phosphoribosyltransferase